MPGQRSSPSKRLCIFSDGTWNTPELSTLTNIGILAKSLKYQNSDGIPQICYYDPGIGTEGGALDRLRGGAFGVGIDLNIQQLYTFLAMNYTEGDEIYMFGFSRGAYTVRSLAGMMHESGLVYREHLDYVKEAYDLYRDNEDIDSYAAKEFRNKYARRVPIKLLLCFDTVGALGLPEGLPFPLSSIGDEDRYRFHNTDLSEYIENAIHLMSIDENKRSFAPTYMTPNAKRGVKQLTQKFMPGSHGGVGGGNAAELELSRNALFFALEDIKERRLGIEFGGDLLPKEYTYNIPPKPQGSWFGRANILKSISGGEMVREIKSLDELHETVIRRYNRFKSWRPESLSPLNSALLALSDSF
ncbi:unnamed protein product [Agarophyton chilense]|eukprot:gb/GEZJ01001431.1/.p1 GENE.gb/GEZJ01001431.1/~~gb/GEZJ01001431.1/.p1  ORF type:complete len:357 (-),score=53.18 gb/GEZJ01001431.1/:1941-3011(-)